MTGRGWALLALAAALWLWARALGVNELSQIALGLLVLCIGARVWMRQRNRGLHVSRSFGKSRVERGEPIDLELVIRNFDSGSTPALTVEETLPRHPGPLRTEIPPLRIGDHRVTRPVEFQKRGRYLFERISVTLTDPYGIARSTRRFSDPVSVLVYPKVEALSTPDTALRTTQTEGARRAPAPRGEDFYGVREYRPGDDPRRIHWATTARLGTLMIREEEISGRDRVSILLDDRAPAHTEATFDWSADAAASLASLYLRLGLQVRLVRPGGTEIPAGRGAGQYERIMEELATASLRQAAEEKLLALARRGQDDILVMVLGEIGAPTVGTLARIAGRYRELVVVFGPGIESPLSYGSQLARTGARVVHAVNRPLSQAWDLSMGRTAPLSEPVLAETMP